LETRLATTTETLSIDHDQPSTITQRNFSLHLSAL
jgi:hypothetical protein